MNQPRAEAVIDIAAYRRNVQTLAARVHPAKLMAVVKGDAYGHGLLPLARAAVAVGITDVGALDIETALALRRGGINPPIGILAWLHTAGDDYSAAIDAHVDLGVSTIGELETLVSAGAVGAARVHLKIDTGLHRNGASEEDWPELVLRALEAERAGAIEVYGVWTHIAEASDDEDTAAIARFSAAIATAERLGARFTVRHLAASAAGFARGDSRFDLVRMGAFTFGISPGGGVTAADLGLVPVMTLTSRVNAISGGEAGVIASVPIGYGDGILGECANRVFASIRGRQFPIVAVKVDSIDVHVEGSDVSEGDEVTLFGTGSSGEQTLQEWADALGTIGEEIVVRLSPNLMRRYANE